MTKTKAKTNDFPVIEDTPVITEAVALATLNDEVVAVEEPVVAGEFSDTDSINEIDDAPDETDDDSSDDDSSDDDSSDDDEADDDEADDDEADDDEADETALVSEHPTVDEAREMFEGNPGLAEVLTDRGVVRRVDILGGKKLGLDGLYR